MTIDRFEGEERVVERWERVFAALTAEPRRNLIVALVDAGTGQPVDLPEAAMSPALTSDRRVVHYHLHHRHLPMLAESGFVEWEAEPFRAWRGPNFEDVAIVVRSLYESVGEIPDRLVFGCRRLELEREGRANE